MQRTKFIVAVLIGFTLCASLRASAGSDAVTVTGAVDKPGDWTIAKIKSDLASDVTSITYTSHGQKHTASAVPLLSLLQSAGVQTQMKMDPNADPKTKNYELRVVIVIQAGDGYAVTFSLAELLANVGNRHVWLALDADGQPLPARDGPMRLIVPEDESPARWIHAIQTISVINPTAPTTRPAN